MKTSIKTWLVSLLVILAVQAHGQTVQKVVNIPTRSGVTQRMLVLSPPEPKAAVILLAGGHGGLQIFPNGSFKWGDGNFLVRTRQLFADQGLIVAVLDAPSDRQGPPFLSGFRQTPEHAEDIKAVIARLRIPVLVVHHEQDGCSLCHFSDLPSLMDKLGNSPRKQLLSFKGGHNSGDPCEAQAYHGFNGLERDVVGQTATWMLAK